MESLTSKSLETLAQEAFAEIGMHNSSFMPPTGCSLIRLPDEAQPSTAEYIQQLLKNTKETTPLVELLARAAFISLIAGL